LEAGTSSTRQAQDLRLNSQLENKLGRKVSYQKNPALTLHRGRAIGSASHGSMKLVVMLTFMFLPSIPATMR
jgi:hypothetical protein